MLHAGIECGLGKLQHSLWPDVHSNCLAIWAKAVEVLNFHPEKQLFQVFAQIEHWPLDYKASTLLLHHGVLTWSILNMSTLVSNKNWNMTKYSKNWENGYFLLLRKAIPKTLSEEWLAVKKSKKKPSPLLKITRSNWGFLPSLPLVLSSTEANFISQSHKGDCACLGLCTSFHLSLRRRRGWRRSSRPVRLG